MTVFFFFMCVVVVVSLWLFFIVPLFDDLLCVYLCVHVHVCVCVFGKMKRECDFDFCAWVVVSHVFFYRQSQAVGKAQTEKKKKKKKRAASSMRATHFQEQSVLAL